MQNKFEKHSQRAATMYGSPYGPALDSFHARFEARNADDRDAVDISRASKQPLKEFFGKKSMSPAHAHALLAKGLEYDERPRSPEAQAKMAQHTFETLRREFGTKEAEALVAKHRQFFDEARAAAQPLVTRFEVNGLHCDPAVIRITSQYGK